MDSHDNTTTVDMHERGFDGQVVIEGADGARFVRISGVRPQDGANVVKEVPADRDAELTELVSHVVNGDDGAATRLLAHVGVLDPPLPE